ncbi:MAG: ATP-dependent DNA helicase RecG [Candidatus Kerfeldbacteria bacterium]|nr:ATP-dependent DNA helicase RecG [Candidatus Kerfeldbacteria bacterium]
MRISINTPIGELPRVGPALTKRLNKLGITTVADLLWYYPFRYEDYSTITPIVDIHTDTKVTIKGQVTLIANKRVFRRRMFITECIITDDTGSIKAVWFNQPFITKLLAQGDLAYFSGTVEMTKFGLQLVGPQYEKIKKEQTHTARIVPMYSLTERLTEKQIRFLIKLVLPLAEQIPDWMPESLRRTHKLIPLHQALREIHFPTNKNTLVQARTRLKINELLLLQLQSRLIRAALQSKTAPVIPFDETLTKTFVGRLPFTLTDDQRRAAWTILQDLQKTTPMNRLLQGDVGSGKTVVAAIAMLNASRAHFQSALMAPTEILALQHYATITTIIAPEEARIALLTRSKKMLRGKLATSATFNRAIEQHEVDILVGTHALIQDKVKFAQLGFIIIDEQHRFGVDQRKQLKQKSDSGTIPHLLSMTATPIPRSLALTVYGDLDVSTITQMPPGRKPIMTKVVPPEKREAANEFIRKEISAGRQAFVICPLIEESDKLGVKAATDEHKRLQQDIFPELQIGLLHGKMNIEEKEHAMNDFSAGKTNILVATAVVEVGIDVPNASVMVIEGADRFGLAQLHQFRGRVGRAAHQSYCLVFTDATNDKAIERLTALTTTQNGFILAEKDLEMRGPGEVYGLRQSGFPELKIATLTDLPLIMLAKSMAEEILTDDPDLSKNELLAKQLRQSSRSVHLE